MRKHSVIVESKNPLLTGRDVWQNQAKGEAVCYEQFEDEGKEMRTELRENTENSNCRKEKTQVLKSMSHCGRVYSRGATDHG